MALLLNVPVIAVTSIWVLFADTFAVNVTVDVGSETVTEVEPCEGAAVKAAG